MSKCAGATNAKIIALMVAATLGFGLLQGARLVDVNSGPYSNSPLALWGLAVDGAAFLAVAALSYSGRIEGWRSLFVAGTASIAVYAFMAVFAPDDMAMLALMQTFAGLGWSLNVLCWMAVFACYRSRYALPMIAIAYAVNVCMQPLSSALVPYDKAFLIVILAASIVLLRICLAKNTFIAAAMREAFTPRTSLSEAFSRTRRAVAGACAFSLVCGFVIQSDLTIYGMGYSQTDTTAAIAFVVSLTMAFVLIAFRIEKADLDYAFPIAAAFVATTLMVRVTGWADPSLAGSLMTVALISFYVLLWLMLVSEARQRMLPPFLLLGAALGVARLSVAVGRGAFVVLHDAGIVAEGFVDTLSLWFLVVASSLIFLAYLKASSRSRFAGNDADAIESDECDCALDGVCGRAASSTAEKESGEALRNAESSGRDRVWCADAAGVRPADAVSAGSLPKGAPSSAGAPTPVSREPLSAAGPRFEGDAFDEAARRFGFSQRETQVMREYAAGRSARYIADWYMLSEHTVKTHIRHAYAKADVHSRQEFLDAIERVESDVLQFGA